MLNNKKGKTLITGTIYIDSRDCYNTEYKCISWRYGIRVKESMERNTRIRCYFVRGRRANIYWL